MTTPPIEAAIIKIIRDVGELEYPGDPDNPNAMQVSVDELEEILTRNLVAASHTAADRSSVIEECARVCDAEIKEWGVNDDGSFRERYALEQCADDIRALHTSPSEVLVPVEPTEAMLTALDKSIQGFSMESDRELLRRNYKSMILAHQSAKGAV